MSYNRHFPRSFLLNYGPALQNPADQAILSRLHSWNCEWLSRPNIAISELARTVKDNITAIRQFEGSVLTSEFVESLVGPLEKLMPALIRLDNKDKGDTLPATRDDATSLLRKLHEDTQLHTTLTDAFNMSGPVFVVATQCIAIKTLMANIEEFAEKTAHDAKNQAFKQDPSPTQMKNYLLQSILKKRTLIPQTRSVWDDEEDEPAPSPSVRRREKRSWSGENQTTPSCKHHQRSRAQSPQLPVFARKLMTSDSEAENTGPLPKKRPSKKASRQEPKASRVANRRTSSSSSSSSSSSDTKTTKSARTKTTVTAVRKPETRTPVALTPKQKREARVCGQHKKKEQSPKEQSLQKTTKTPSPTKARQSKSAAQEKKSNKQ